jgi:hypothetical protein
MHTHEQEIAIASPLGTAAVVIMHLFARLLGLILMKDPSGAERPKTIVLWIALFLPNFLLFRYPSDVYLGRCAQQIQGTRHTGRWAPQPCSMFSSVLAPRADEERQQKVHANDGLEYRHNHQGLQEKPQCSLYHPGSVRYRGESKSNESEILQGSEIFKAVLNSRAGSA